MRKLTPTKLTPAMKAAVTREARRSFRNRYPVTADVAELVIKGYSNTEIADFCDVYTSSVAAVRANLSRSWSTYATMAKHCAF